MMYVNQIFVLVLATTLVTSFALNQAFASGGLCEEWAKKSLKWAEICYRDNKGKK